MNHASDPGVDEVRLEKTGNWHYTLTGSQEPETHADRYLLMGRVYIDKYNFGALDDMPVGGRLLPREWKRKPLGLGKEYEIL
jgi:hypothetical protein